MDVFELDQLVDEAPDHFRVDGRLYTDPKIFDMEMRAIFEQGWVYVAHISQLANKGDFIATTIGRQPVIIVRPDDAAEVKVLINRCRHRGTTVCREAAGNTRVFRCMYHGWSYDLEGRLISVPFRSPAYDGVDDLPAGLVAAPRVDVYHGFVFASLSAEGRSLEQHLGKAGEFIEAYARFGRVADAPIDVSRGVSRARYEGNWKLQLENTCDSYHQEWVHQFMGRLIDRRRGTAVTDRRERRVQLSTWDLGGGHGVLELTPDPLNAGTTGKVFQGPGFHISIFPNVCLLPTQIRVLRPQSVECTEVDSYPVFLVDMSDDDVRFRLRAFEDFYGPAGFGAPDDLEAFRQVQAGLRADSTPELRWVDFSRGLTNERLVDGGQRSSAFSDETPQRAIYREWRRQMVDVR